MAVTNEEEEEEEEERAPSDSIEMAACGQAKRTFDPSKTICSNVLAGAVAIPAALSRFSASR